MKLDAVSSAVDLQTRSLREKLIELQQVVDRLPDICDSLKAANRSLTGVPSPEAGYLERRKAVMTT